eukprot:Hpha_TRINITY_DN16856_c0_g2::TRINITY_DN16856_c0_g2_i1::g.152339::m.152339
MRLGAVGRGALRQLRPSQQTRWCGGKEAPAEVVAELVTVAGEDEFGRPTDVPPGLTADNLIGEHEYWMERFQNARMNSTTDVAGRRMVPTKPGDTGFLFDPRAPADTETNPLTMENLSHRIHFPGCTNEKLEVPVFNMKKEQVGTRVLDNYVFGRVPEAHTLFQIMEYELKRRQGFGGWMKYRRDEAPGARAKFMTHLNAPGQVRRDLGGGRRGVRSWHPNLQYKTGWSGADTGKHSRQGRSRWQDQRRDLSPFKQSDGLRMAMTMKLNKEQLIIIDDLKFPVPSIEIMRDWSHSWGFDRDRLMAYIIDGGTQWAPRMEMDPNNFWTNVFTYGLQIQEPRSLNAYDALRYRYLVMTEGAITQLERFFDPEKSAMLPPHIASKMTHKLADLDEKEWDWTTVDEEGAWEVAKEEEKNLDGFRDLDDPWLNGQRWDENEKRIREHRKFVASNLPRLGDPINDDMREYWESRDTRLPPEDELPAEGEYQHPWQYNRNRQG